MSALKEMVPAGVRSWLRQRRRAAQKAMIHLDRLRDWSALRRVHPYRKDFGAHRGTFVDRFYIEQFLAIHAQDIRGHVAEMESPQYTRRFGADNVERSDVLDINEHNTLRTMTVDLAQPDAAPEGRFDCILCTQTIFLIRDYHAAIRSLYKMLKSGGILLLTVPGISPRVPQNLVAGEGEDWWRFTARSAQYEFEKVFGAEYVETRSYGNVLSAVAFLHGLVQEELTREELEFHDPNYEVIVAVRAIKPPDGSNL